jgi:hypothetical protein
MGAPAPQNFETAFHRESQIKHDEVRRGTATIDHIVKMQTSCSDLGTVSISAAPSFFSKAMHWVASTGS